MFCHLYQIKLTPCLAICQNCGIIPLKAADYKVFDAMIINVILRGVFFEHSIVLILSAVILIVSKQLIYSYDDICVRSDLDTRAIIASHFAWKHRSDSDSYLNSGFAGLLAINGITLYFHSN